MAMKFQQIRESALALSKPSRKKLLRELILSMNEEIQASPKKIQEEWLTEAEARIDAFNRGELETISLSQFLTHINRVSHGSQTSRRRAA